MKIVFIIFIIKLIWYLIINLKVVILFTNKYLVNYNSYLLLKICDGE